MKRHYLLNNDDLYIYNFALKPILLFNDRSHVKLIWIKRKQTNLWKWVKYEATNKISITIAITTTKFLILFRTFLNFHWWSKWADWETCFQIFNFYYIWAIQNNSTVQYLHFSCSRLSWLPESVNVNSTVQIKHSIQ